MSRFNCWLLSRDKARKENTIGLRCCIVAMLLISFAIGYLVHHDHPLLGGTAVVALALNYIAFWRLAGMEAGSQGLLPKQTLLYSLYAATVAGVLGLPWAFSYQLQACTGWPVVWDLTGFAMVIALAGSIVLLGAGTGPLFGSLICLLTWLSPLIWPIGATPTHSAWMAFLVGITILPLGSVKYRFEQCSLGMVPLIIANAMRTGVDLGSGHPLLPLRVLFALLLAYLQVIWMRRKRVLPTSLQGCRFVTLAYFRKLAARGEGIRRCQDLPPEAFGDPHRARFLIAVSHRWIDRFTCDQSTLDCPEGLRLHSLVQQLNLVFSTEGFGRGTGWKGKFQRFQCAMTGGSDVLVFVDFMSLPQEGKSDDGSLVLRTEKENEVFQQCLPSMGVLYSMFPVLACKEVPDGHASYSDSGWCFSESATAWLGDQLTLFPANTELRRLYDQQMPNLEDLEVARSVLDGILDTKHFLFEMDRSITQTMIGGFVLKRRLLHSLQDKSALDLKWVLAEIAEGGFGSLVDQPVDSALNTPLHHAVALNFRQGVQLLMDAGADKSLVNIFGDSPVQFYMFPRLCGAARLCRQLQTRTDGAICCQQDTFSSLAHRYTLSGTSAGTPTQSMRLSFDSSMLCQQVTQSQEHPQFDVLRLTGEIGPRPIKTIDTLDSNNTFTVISLDDVCEDCEVACETISSFN